MPIDENYRKTLLQVFKRQKGKVLNLKQIWLKTGQEVSRDILLNALQQMEGKDIEKVGKHKFKLKSQSIFIEGEIDICSDGNAYLIPNRTKSKLDDVFIPKSCLNSSLNKDRVRVLLTSTKLKKRGKVVEILKRHETKFLGKVAFEQNRPILIVSQRKFPYTIYVKESSKIKIMVNEKAVVEIVDWKYRKHALLGKVVEVLGQIGLPEVEASSILREFHIPTTFKESTLKEAESVKSKIEQSEINKRLDFRDILTFTIDPINAKDFDDALSFRVLENAHFEIGVHIADVSHYVRVGSALDTESFLRGTSVYLVDKVIPMLPERISNNICSLNPKEDKLTFSVIFEFNQHYEIVNYKISKTIINSNHRFSYQDAQKILEMGEGRYSEELKILNDIAKILRKKRFDEGAINFESNEVYFELDEQGLPINAYLREHNDAHRLIEDFMLLANKTIATEVKSNHKSRAFVYRVHDEPNEELLGDFSNYAKQRGHKLDFSSKKNIPKALNNFLEQIVESNEKNLFSSMAIRCMSKALYSTKNIGHYGLGFKAYSHFTSPIRRYPDLIAHRIMYQIINGEKSMNVAELDDICEHSSNRERVAIEAERTSIKLKQAQYLSQFIGKTFNGIIESITSWGIFISMEENHCSGMLKVSALKDDYYTFIAEKVCLKGRRTKKIIHLGDRLKVMVNKVDIEKREVDLVPSEE